MNFDYYFKKYDEEYGFNDSELCGFEIGFEVGQQSKQEEVNKLQVQLDQLQAEIDKRLSDYQLEVSQVGQSCVKWKEIAEGKQAEIDVLKAKLDNLSKWAEFHIEDYNLSESESEHDRGWFNAACQVFKMLKESNNDT